MERSGYGFGRKLSAPYEQAVDQVLHLACAKVYINLLYLQS